MGAGQIPLDRRGALFESLAGSVPGAEPLLTLPVGRRSPPVR